MGNKCLGCKNKCGSADAKAGNTFTVTGYVLKDAYTGNYLDVDDSVMGKEPPYYLHGDRKDALRFSTRDEAYRELAEVLLAGIDTGVNPSHDSYLRLRPVKLVKKSA